MFKNYPYSKKIKKFKKALWSFVDGIKMYYYAKFHANIFSSFFQKI